MIQNFRARFRAFIEPPLNSLHQHIHSLNLPHLLPIIRREVPSPTHPYHIFVLISQNRFFFLKSQSRQAQEGTSLFYSTTSFELQLGEAVPHGAGPFQFLVRERPGLADSVTGENPCHRPMRWKAVLVRWR